MSLKRIDIISLVREIKFFAFCYPILVVADLITKNESFNIYINKIGILCGIIFIFLIIANLLERGHAKPVPFLTSASFFIFAIHDPWLLRQLKKLLHRVIKPESDLEMCISNFLLVIVVVIISLLIYQLLKKIIPSFVLMITGSQ